MEYLVPVTFAILTWWVSTLLLMRCILRARQRSKLVLVVMTVIALLSFVAVFVSRDWTTPLGVYLAFLSALGLWAWHEATYFLGFVTGPRPEACPPGVSAGQRFLFGVRVSLYHELAIVLTAIAVAWVTIGSSNQTAMWVFVLLWLMRWSAKLNIFLGVRNLHQEYWPVHLQYLASYAKSATMNPLYPVTAGLSLLAFGWLIAKAAASTSAYELTAFVLIAVLLFLALLEHAFLMYRVPDGRLWRWAVDGGKSGNLPTDDSRLRPSQGP
ncbi:MAG TPA: putative photosynthetic complex assembly protein PuhE [Xanthomonadales bacterium]|nr:putative photosynthetic complex assembly protein PuhE [Xanthomonadales bacterium]